MAWEFNIEAANVGRRLKSQESVEECRKNGWKISCTPIEVGGRGFATLQDP